MSNANKPRNMSVKGFLHKCTTKAATSAEGFIAAHRAWLETGELCEVTSPILRMLDEGQLFPTPALDLLQTEVLTHHLRVESLKAEKKLLDASNGTETRTSKPWISRIFDAKGNLVITKNAKGEEVELEETFQSASDADRWTDRRLFEGASDWFGVVQHTRIMRADGEPLTSVIMRQDAIARILKIPKSPLVKKTGTRDNRLSFGVKVAQSRAHFSHG
jgi:hypothetical protein